MYHVSPFTYLIEALVGQCMSLFLTVLPGNSKLLSAFGHQQINCAEKELVTLQPISGQSCGSYLARFISQKGGFVTNPDALSDCHFCTFRTTDQWLGSTFNILFSRHWRNFGIFWAYIIINVSSFFIVRRPRVVLNGLCRSSPCTSSHTWFVFVAIMVRRSSGRELGCF